jgi:hypothetical protein
MARLDSGQKEPSSKLHDNDDKQKGIELSNLFGVFSITERRGSKNSQETGSGRETAPKGPEADTVINHTF